uniref:Uncharacterized protein n=1 Tax=Manihot esculenta TaxID=3983 RepID=A0A2C9V6R1_MANES
MLTRYCKQLYYRANLLSSADKNHHLTTRLSIDNKTKSSSHKSHL